MSKNCFAIGLLFLLGGCAKKYKVPPLKHVNKKSADFVEKKEDVEIRINHFDYKKLGSLFKSSFNKRDMEGYLLTIKNNSDQNVFLDYKNIDLSLVSTQELYQGLSKRPLTRLGVGLGATVALGFTAVTLASIPFCCMAPCFFASCGFLATIFSGAATPVIFLGSIFGGVGSATFNAKLEKELTHRIVSQVSVKPEKKYSTLFVTRNQSKAFNITLVNGDGKQLVTFNVKL